MIKRISAEGIEAQRGYQGKVGKERGPRINFTWRMRLSVILQVR